ncbi:uncharacterized protein LOC126904121 [Daktulosphaira vitifoliae]|uniref:uncharacterized protein LOC126904121 n=1 Tax=Daktulosphaira vitifoliae TaxID=58002 RepID=UPI0021AAA10B|nr:uncharacterized protein LOC126904121 [Daktulosphaira vitifoliae]
MNVLHFVITSILFLNCNSQLHHPFDDIGPLQSETDERVKNITLLTRNVLEHYQNPDPVGLPKAINPPYSDPEPIPDSNGVAWSMYNSTMRGHSKFRLKQLYVNIVDIQLEFGISIDTLEVVGNYSTWQLFQTYIGYYNVTLVDLHIDGLVSLKVSDSGHLETNNIDMNMNYKSLHMNTNNINFPFYETFVNGFASFVVQTIKPIIMKIVNIMIKDELNEKMKHFKRFPNTIPPIDLLIAESRQQIKSMGFDPWRLDDIVNAFNFNIFSLDVNNIWILGLSNIYRLGDMNISIQNRTIISVVHIGTQELEGHCQWKIGAAGILKTTGTTSFSIDYIRVEANVTQPMDTRLAPILNEMGLSVGNIQLRMDGAGTLDYLAEALINIIPNIVRNQIVNAMELPIKKRIQDVLDKINIQEKIEQRIPPIIDKMMEHNITDIFKENEITHEDISIMSKEDF